MGRRPIALNQMMRTKTGGSQESPWLCFTAEEANASVMLKNVNGTYQTSTDGVNWTNYTLNTTITLANVGDKVYFAARTTNATCYQYTEGGITRFTLTGKVAASGNIMSLLDFNCQRTDVPDQCFNQFFYYQESLISAPELPATTVGIDGYTTMFAGCTSLTQAPELPATELASRCYYSMFYDCTSLTGIVIINANILQSYSCNSMFKNCAMLDGVQMSVESVADNSCQEMFYGCSSLTSAPALPATTLAPRCYYYMFSGCSSLTQAPELPATTLANYCYQNMFYGCLSLTQAPELPATIMVTRAYNSMFKNCKALTAPPNLPATTFAMQCYYQMFYGCTNIKISQNSTIGRHILDLTTVSSLPSQATYQMFQSTGGTFKGTPTVGNKYMSAY